MEVIPAIDLRGGKCVRLYQGDFSQETVFSEDPVAVARRWQEEGASRLHVVDLDGARSGHPAQQEVIRRIVQSVKLPVQVGGGLRTLEAVADAVALGAGRAVLGTAAVEDEALVAEASRRFGERLVVAIDARGGMAATRGWERQTELPAAKLASRMARLGVKRMLYTDIAQDGTLAGPNFPAIAEVMAASGLVVIASGGVSTLEHIRRLKEMGVEGCIVGRALYTGALDLRLALAAASHSVGANPHRFDVRRMGLLEDAARKKELNPEKTLDLLPLESHQTVADIGCGPGYFSLPLARRLPKGKVYAMDVQPEMLERLRLRAAKANVKNIDIKLCQELELPLPPGSLDGAFLAFVLHEMVGQREDFLWVVKALLKPGGWVGIVEWVKAATGGGPPRVDRIAQEEAKALAEKVGLKVVREEGLGERYYFLLCKLEEMIL